MELSLTLATTVASASWFAPLANSRVYENAFALPYTGVNMICLYANLGLLAGVSLISTGEKTLSAKA